MLAPVAYLFGRSAASAGFCAVMAFWASCADAQLRLPGEGGDVLIQPPGHKVQVIGTAAPDPGEKIAFEAFASKTLYYGALYIDVTAADLAYYVDNFHTLAAAKTVAKAACESGAEAASHCEIYAIVTPSADKALEDGAQTLSESAARTFLDSFLALEKTSMFGAFSVSGLGDMAYFVLPQSAESVSEKAQQACAGFVAETMGNLHAAAQQAAVQARLETCRVIYLRYPRG